MADIRGGWTESADDGGPDWVVRPVAGSRAAKGYRCPGCDQEIPAGAGHLVAYPEDRLDERRHWHKACWERRGHRRPRTQRGRNAPRF